MLLAIYRRLRRRFGHQNWWPGRTPEEIIIGAVLTQRAAWGNAVKALENLRRAGALEFRSIAQMDEAGLEELVRPSGTYRQKAAGLKALAEYLMHRCGGDLGELAAARTERLRRELLGIKGIGQETADCILLYALGKPVFVVDAYTVRALGRIGLGSGGKSYRAWQEWFMEHLPRSVELFNDFHAQWVALGKNYCRVRPECNECPIKDLCATGRRTSAK